MVKSIIHYINMNEARQLRVAGGSLPTTERRITLKPHKMEDHSQTLTIKEDHSLTKTTMTSLYHTEDNIHSVN